MTGPLLFSTLANTTMLSDLIAAFTTPASPAHRALGYLDETRAMRRRARISRQAWQPHLAHTAAFLLSAAERCRDRNRIVILGSGLLLDVPLPELSGMFTEVVLQDVVCLPETRKRIRAFPNVTFLEHDVTGLAGILYRNRGKDLQTLPDVPNAEPPGDADLMVSLNILSQLWVVPRLYVGQHLKQLAPEEVDEWCARIVTSHFEHLRSFPGAVCLVADFETRKRDRAGTIVSRSSTVYGLELPQPDEQWVWNIAPLGNANPHHSKELIVGAWNFSTDLDASKNE